MSAPPARKKGINIGRALKTAARLPVRAVGAGKGSGRHGFTPLPGETPMVCLRVRIMSCTDLLAKDRNGFSDPFVVATLLGSRFQTPSIKRTVNPTYQPKDSTFDFPIYLSLADKLGALELVIWDKDMLGKDYLGEVAIPLEKWFPNPAIENNKPCFGYEDPANETVSLDVISTRANTPSQGTIQVKIGFVSPPNTHVLSDFSEIYTELVKSSRRSLVSAPPTEGLGTIRSVQGGPEYQDDGGLSSDSSSDSGEDEDDEFFESPLSTPGIPSSDMISPTSPTTPTPLNQAPTPRIPGKLPPGASSEKKKKFRKSWAGTGSAKRGYHLSAENDIVGIVMLEVSKAEDLPKLKNMTRMGWDMDPFVVISFGKKVFRTRVIRHSLNPVWDEKLIFHVRRYETAFKVQFTVLDWDKLSANDHVGDASMDVKKLLDSAPQPDPNTGLYAANEEGAHPMRDFSLPLSTAKEMPWEAKHNPTISFRAKFQPYDALRQQFWRQYLKQYDTDDTMTISHLELTSMLDSLGSTLTRTTINSFFTRFGKRPLEDELTFEETIMCLETEVGRPRSEKRHIDEDDALPDTSTSATPVLSLTGGKGEAISLDQLDFSGPPMVPASEENHRVQQSGLPQRVDSSETVPMQQPLSTAATQADANRTSDASDLESDSGDRKSRRSRFRKRGKKEGSTSEKSTTSASESSGSADSVERVINVKNCPLCHRPRLNSKAEVDIITHLAICASQDWAKVDRIVVGNFVTANQAQRKWYTKIISKVSSGDYRLGANSANIIVQNRITGQLEEEKMQVYVRLGIRLLYKGAKSRMESSRARGLLKSLSIKQGIKYDAPESAADIPAFIEFHNLNVNEILDPLDSFKSFNEFFYRKLKPEARPVEEPDNPYRLVSSADCRLMGFETIQEATKLWIKGREFTVAKLLGDTYKDDFDRYNGGALVIFRLAPQDYHRFHTPVDGRVGKMTYISGEYYTVNPQAIRTALDVYGENARKIVPIDSPQFGRVMAVCIGAMMVGTIRTTVEEGQEIKRGEEFGYFAFGGSTIVMLFEKGSVELDEDLLLNGRASLETLVRVGMGIGRGRRG